MKNMGYDVEYAYVYWFPELHEYCLQENIAYKNFISKWKKKVMIICVVSRQGIQIFQLNVYAGSQCTGDGKLSLHKMCILVFY